MTHLPPGPSGSQHAPIPAGGGGNRPRGLDATTAALKARVVGTRKPMAWWDRIKVMLVLAIVFAFMVSAKTSDNPIMSVHDAIDITAREKRWLIWLMLVEVLRQLHYVVSEHWSDWNEYFGNRIFGTFNRRASRMNDWNRYRLARTFKWLLLLLIVSVIAGDLFNVPAARGIPELLQRLWDNLPMIVQIALYMLLSIGSIFFLYYFMSKGGYEVYFPEDITTRFSDVYGQDHVLARIQENVLFIENPESIEDKGGYVPGGILLWGPPGTGKTLIAEAVAGETNKPFVFVEPGAFIQMFMGVGILKVKALFRKLRRLAVRYGGVIVFFDEADSLGSRGAGVGGMGMARPGFGNEHLQCCNGGDYISGPTSEWLFWEQVKAQHAAPATTAASHGDAPGQGKRGIIMGGMGGGGMGTIQALLTELSGLKKPRGFLNRHVRRALGMRPKPPPKYRILVMMATNLPSALDQALLRPGRIDRQYRVGYPSKEGRRRTFEGYLSRVNHELTDDDIDKLAAISTYATGASIKDYVNEALVLAVRDGRESITWKDIIRAKQIKEHGIPDDFEYVERERHSIAIHEACHAVAMVRLQRSSMIDVATIERRGGVGGFVSPINMEDLFVQWKSELEIEIMTFLASLAGERMFFEGDNTMGVGGDLASSTAIALRMEGFWGMGSTLGSRNANFASMRGLEALEDGVDRQVLDTALGGRVEERLQELYGRVQAILADNRFEILSVAHALEAHKSITGDDIKAVMEGVKGPIVDGRPYHEGDFRQALETYHVQAVTAQKNKTGKELSLPVAEGEPDIDLRGSPVLVPSASPGPGTRAPAEDPVYRPVPYARPPGTPGNGSTNGHGDSVNGTGRGRNGRNGDGRDGHGRHRRDVRRSPTGQPARAPAAAPGRAPRVAHRTALRRRLIRTRLAAPLAVDGLLGGCGSVAPPWAPALGGTMVDLTPAESEEALESADAWPHDGDVDPSGGPSAEPAAEPIAGLRHPSAPAPDPRYVTKPDFMPPSDHDDQPVPDDHARHHLTRAQILGHAVRLAHVNGWRLLAQQYQVGDGSHREHEGYVLTIRWNTGEDPAAARDPDRWELLGVVAEKILFDKSFAQAIWGGRDHYGSPAWQHHLQQLTLSDDRLLYLGQHLYDEMP